MAKVTIAIGKYRMAHGTTPKGSRQWDFTVNGQLFMCTMDNYRNASKKAIQRYIENGYTGMLQVEP